MFPSACLVYVCVCASIHYLICIRIHLSGRQECTGQRGMAAIKNRAWPATLASLGEVIHMRRGSLS